MISETKEVDEVLDEKIDSAAAEEEDTELEDNTVMDFDYLTITGGKQDYYLD